MHPGTTATTTLTAEAGAVSSPVDAPTGDPAGSTHTVRRADYLPAAYTVPSIELCFELDAALTTVHCSASYERHPRWSDPMAGPVPLRLDGEDLELVEIRLDGEVLSAERYRVHAAGLDVLDPPPRFTLQTTVRIRPQDNGHLSGLYASGAALLTQCEAQGFRRITYALDRPDVMSRYRVELRADEKRYPVLLSNGNLLSEERVQHADGTWLKLSRWDDPFPKPSYLFALVAGNLECNQSTMQTASGRQVLLQIWCEPGLLPRTEFAMQCLRRAIRWDEERYGLELDLDRYMIVAAPDFNMGAMENKGLNIFNMKYLFADPRIATDDDFARIESIIGHEYFHNWTGNRVTCRDWFQLTLKEGLTVFRDQQFSADCLAATAAEGAASARAVHRIECVRQLRAAQFPEDAGPMSHPIRPDEYQAIDNFYTATVYEKGAEVIRMLQAWVGEDGFRAGMDLYFERHDGQAVTCDDFVSAVCDATQRDPQVFMRWYSTAGTPHLLVAPQFDADTGRYSLHVRQWVGGGQAAPLLIPVALGLLDRSGREVHAGTVVVDQAEQRIDFEGFSEAPVPSVLRGFSAPVILHLELSDDDLAFLLRHDTDAFNRWESAQRLMVRCILAECRGEPRPASLSALLSAMADAIVDPSLTDGFRNALLLLPTEGTLTEHLDIVDPVALRRARHVLRAQLAEALHVPLGKALDRARNLGDAVYPDGAAVALRALAGTSLALLASIGDARAIEQAQHLADRARGMTDRLAGVQALMLSTAALRDEALGAFERDFRDEPTVMDKWFMLQATMVRLEGDAPVLDRVRALLLHPAYSTFNPNKVRAVVHSFCAGNLAEFHRVDGQGYDFWVAQVLQHDALNPQLAARLARALDRHTKFDGVRRSAMRSALESVARSARSADVREIVLRALRSEAGG